MHTLAKRSAAAISAAIMAEVVSLHIYLETSDKRPDILKAYPDNGIKAAGAMK